MLELFREACERGAEHGSFFIEQHASSMPVLLAQLSTPDAVAGGMGRPPLLMQPQPPFNERRHRLRFAPRLPRQQRPLSAWPLQLQRNRGVVCRQIDRRHGIATELIPHTYSDST